MTTIATLGVKLVADTSQLSRQVRSVPKDFDAASQSANNAKKNISGVGDASKKSASTIGDMRADLSKAAIALGSVAAAAYTAKKAFDFAQEGASIQRLEQSGSAFAASMGADFVEMRDAIVEASDETITRFDAMQSASRAMALGVSTDAGQLADLMEVARFRARLMGTTTTSAFDDIVTGIGRLSPKILDNLGIVFDAESTYATYAQTLGTTADKLTEAEKVQALLTQTIQTGKDQMEAAGGIAADNAQNFEQLATAWGDLTDSGKVLLARVLGPSVQRTAELARAMADGDDVLRAYLMGWTEWSGIGQEAVRTHYEIIDAQNRFGIQMAVAGQYIDEYGNVVANSRDELLNMARVQQAETDRLQAQADAYMQSAEAAKESGKATEEAQHKLEDFVVQVDSIPEQKDIKINLSLPSDLATKRQELLYGAAGGQAIAEFQANVLPKLDVMGLDQQLKSIGQVTALDLAVKVDAGTINAFEAKQQLMDALQISGQDASALFDPMLEGLKEKGPEFADEVLGPIRDQVGLLEDDLNAGAAFEEFFGAAGDAADTFKSDSMQPVADTIGDARDSAYQLAKKLGEMDGMTVTVTVRTVGDQIPQASRAHGGFLSGWTMVGEHGRELVSPWGYVFDANTSRKLVEGGLMPDFERAFSGPIGGGGTSGGSGKEGKDVSTKSDGGGTASKGGKSLPIKQPSSDGGGTSSSGGTSSTGTIGVASTTPAATSQLTQQIASAVAAAIPLVLAPIIGRQIEASTRQLGEQVATNRRIVDRLNRLIAATESLPNASDQRTAVREGYQTVAQER